MAVRKEPLVPHSGAWSGVYVGTDLVIRNVTLALERRGSRLRGELTIEVHPLSGLRSAVRVSGTHAAGKVTLTATIPATRTSPRLQMSITGHLVNLPADRQAILATTAPVKKVTIDQVGRVPLNGALSLTTGTGATLLSESDGGGWVETNPEA